MRDAKQAARIIPAAVVIVLVAMGMGKKLPPLEEQEVVCFSDPEECDPATWHVESGEEKPWWSGLVEPGDCVAFPVAERPEVRACCELAGVQGCEEPVVSSVAHARRILSFGTWATYPKDQTDLWNAKHSEPTPTVAPSHTPTPTPTPTPVPHPSPSTCVPLRYWEQASVDAYWREPKRTCKQSAFCAGTGNPEGCHEYLVCAPADEYCNRIVCKCESWWATRAVPWGEGRGCVEPADDV